MAIPYAEALHSNTNYTRTHWGIYSSKPQRTDPNDAIGNTIVDPSDEDLSVLRQVRSIHRKAARLISDFINQAKINRQGSTPSTAQKFGRRG
jgi:hypothetical protein